MEKFISIVAIALVGVAFWNLAGLIADFLTPLILKRIRRRKKSSGKQLNRCPMLECRDSGCIYYSDKRRICMFADNPELINPEDSADEN